MPESRTTIYISEANTQRIQRIVALLEAQHAIGLRHADGNINLSALMSYLLKYAENNLKNAEK